MKNGPLALIEDGMPVVVLAPRDSYYKKTISNMQEVIARGAKVLLITNKSKDEIVSENIWEKIEVETTNNDLLPFLLTIFHIQLRIVLTEFKFYSTVTDLAKFLGLSIS
jgi:glucosamine--fructose-6-phosphate aminotransferase (isomerizing)